MVYPLLELADTLNNLILDDKMNVRLKKNSENVTPLTTFKHLRN